MAALKRKERDWEISRADEYQSDDYSSDLEREQDLRILDVLTELSKKIPQSKASDFLHSLASAKDILYWTPKGEILFHNRRIPVTNIAELTDYVLLPYNADVKKPRALNSFLNGLAQVGINKSLIKNKKLLFEIIEREREENFSDESSENEDESSRGQEEQEQEHEEEQEQEQELEQDQEQEEDERAETFSETGSEENTITEISAGEDCANCDTSNTTSTVLQHCPHCKWKDVVAFPDRFKDTDFDIEHILDGYSAKRTPFLCEMCRNRFRLTPGRFVRDKFLKCQDCGFMRHESLLSGRLQNFYPSDEETK